MSEQPGPKIKLPSSREQTSASAVPETGNGKIKATPLPQRILNFFTGAPSNEEQAASLTAQINELETRKRGVETFQGGGWGRDSGRHAGDSGVMDGLDKQLADARAQLKKLQG